ncbi:uncharacterized protein FA14DRAFT_192942 [Meira miltonrushii]|uniref:HECT-type E3 ubiquitin transferase n=1 Tax=Meira miltonrushii TaxID=1280837 RepID=A0A316V1N3_9BASI|nr:uncharacterized protein FA14DRAFT_192942 [Meira miltonrushii]PWN31460.1 hypothetical protein FA14DRAFT_192942 [Meira miltonrushii]
MEVSLQSINYFADQINGLDGDHAQSIKNQFRRTVEYVLVKDLEKRWNTERKACLQVTLAILSIYRKLDIQPGQRFLDLLVHINPDHVSDIFQHQYEENDIAELGYWLVGLCGKLVWESHSALFLAHRIAESAFMGPAILLDCIAQYFSRSSQRIDNSQFHVVAFDALIQRLDQSKQEKWMPTMRSCRHIIPTSTKLTLMEQQFQRRKNENEKLVMYDHIYAGTAYRRDAPDQKHVCHLKVQRDHLLQDSMNCFNKMSKDIVIDGLDIAFIGEDGQDRGGLTKEWCLLMIESLRDIILIQTDDQAEFMDLRNDCTEEQAQLFGIVLGIAILRRVAIDVPLAPYVYDLLSSSDTNTQPSLDMLHYTRPGLADGLSKIMTWDEVKQGSIEDVLGVDFTFFDEKNAKSINLLPNGDQITVSMQNRSKYVDAILFYLLQRRIQDTLFNIREGFSRVCFGISGLELFTFSEWSSLTYGKEMAANTASLQRSCQVLMHAKSAKEREEMHTYLALFWSIVDDFSRDDLRNLLHFVTASHRMLTLRSMNDTAGKESPFTIRLLDPIPTSMQTYPLPTASTCSNTLFLPQYPSYDILQRCLLFAIRNGNQGFGLS